MKIPKENLAQIIYEVEQQFYHPTEETIWGDIPPHKKLTFICKAEVVIEVIKRLKG